MQSINYSSASSWVFLPSELKQSSVDVFYVYPTFYNGPAGSVMPLSYGAKLLPLIKNNVLKNTGIFGAGVNLFAPFYRQSSFRNLLLPPKELDKILCAPYADIIAAFDYYLEHYNNGRPFILAGHSQGSRMLLELLKKRFNKPNIMAKLVAAYLIGLAVTREDMDPCPWLKLASTPSDSGVIITYNAQAPGVKNNFLLKPGTLCTNPLNWSADNASSSLNTGAVFFYPDGTRREVENFTSAHIDASTGALITPEADVAEYSSTLFPKGVFHIFEYEFFYNNLSSNFSLRYKTWLSKNK